MRQQLVNHLSTSIRQGLITLWSDRTIPPGKAFDQEISAKLESADVVLLLVSADFLASDYCYDVEVRRALELHDAGKASVVPVILRDCDWRNAPFGKLEALPTDGRPIRSWPDRDKAYRIVVDGIRGLVAVRAGRDRTTPQDVNRGRPVEHELPPAPVLSLRNLTRSSSVEMLRDEYVDPRIGLQSFMKPLSHLVEIVDGLDLRAADQEFARNGGTINYIFDENIFELFVNPQQWGETIALFHANSWQPSRAQEYSWRNINAQSAILTGEYLFSGSLPGQAGTTVYMTPYHREELANRASQLMELLRRELSHSDVPRDFLFRMADYRAVMAGEKSASIDELEAADQESVLADINVLREAGVATDKLNTYLTTRVALQAIVSDNHAASLLQLQRMIDQKFLESIHPVSRLKRPAPSELSEIMDSADQWFERLAREMKERPPRQLGERRPASLWNDARSLAVAVWLAEEGQVADERTVLVTGDALLFSAYRRWHIETSPDEPFLLRHPSQYTPVLALGDPDIVETPEPNVLRQFVEIALLPLNMGRSPHGTPNLGAQRRHFVQIVRDGGYERWVAGLFPALGSELYKNVMKEMRKLSDAWRRIETITLGLNSDLLAYRIAAELPDAFGFDLKRSAISVRDVDQWLSTTLGSLRQHMGPLWVSVALEAIEQLRVDSSDAAAGASFWAAFEFCFIAYANNDSAALSFKRSTDGRGDLLWLSRPPLEAASLLRQPTITFAVAAFLAGQRSLWSDAERFSNLCVEAAKSEGTSGENLAEAERLSSAIMLARKAKP